MKKIKEIYSQPTCDLLVIRFEQGVLTGSPQAGQSGQAGAKDVYNIYDEDF